MYLKIANYLKEWLEWIKLTLSNFTKIVSENEVVDGITESFFNKINDLNYYNLFPATGIKNSFDNINLFELYT